MRGQIFWCGTKGNWTPLPECRPRAPHQRWPLGLHENHYINHENKNKIRDESRTLGSQFEPVVDTINVANSFGLVKNKCVDNYFGHI